VALPQRFSSSALNQFYVPNKAEEVKFTPKSNKPKGMSKNHRSEAWTLEEIKKSTEEHVVYTWGATDPMRNAALPIKRGEGVYLYDYSGKKYTDMTSQAVNNNLGYGIPKPILDSITN
jgi:4-aminobutyrate aminotransferase-like enzyme